jgi:hypothetical protein
MVTTNWWHVIKPNEKILPNVKLFVMKARVHLLFGGGFYNYINMILK